jgi:hypothetical protein
VGTSHVCAAQYTKVKLASPSMCRYSLRTQVTKRSSMGRKVVRLTYALSTFDIASPVMTIRGSIMEKDRVITRTVVGMLF